MKKKSVVPALFRKGQFSGWLARLVFSITFVVSGALLAQQPMNVALEFVKSNVIFDDRNIVLTPLSGGLTNRVYLVSVSDKPLYVLRVSGNEARSLGVNPAVQAQISKIAGELKVGPKVAAISNDCKFILIEHVTGKELQASQFDTNVREGVLSKLRTLHDHGEFENSFDAFQTAAVFQRTALQKTPDVVNSFPLKKIIYANKIVAMMQQAVKSRAKQFIRSAHNDFHLGNILYDANQDMLWLIDYDYAGKNDLFFDLGILANSLDLDSDAKLELLKVYFAPRTPDIRDVAHLHLMMGLSMYWNSMWYFSQVGSSTIEFDYIKAANDSLERFLNYVASNEFNEALKAIHQT